MMSDLFCQNFGDTMIRFQLASATMAMLISGVASADAAQSKEMFAKAEVAIQKFMPRAYLAYYKGHKSEEVGCIDKVEWRFVFQEENDQRPAAGGFVEYTYRAQIDGMCALLERTVVDTNMAQIPGYYYLVHHGNLAKVNLEWDDALTKVIEKYPSFDWLNAFEVYSPAVPVLKDHVFYAIRGRLNAQMTEVIVDASTGEVEDQSIKMSGKITVDGR